MRLAMILKQRIEIDVDGILAPHAFEELGVGFLHGCRFATRIKFERSFDDIGDRTSLLFRQAMREFLGSGGSDRELQVWHAC